MEGEKRYRPEQGWTLDLPGDDYDVYIDEVGSSRFVYHKKSFQKKEKDPEKKTFIKIKNEDIYKSLEDLKQNVQAKHEESVKIHSELITDNKLMDGRIETIEKETIPAVDKKVDVNRSWIIGIISFFCGSAILIGLAMIGSFAGNG